MDRHALSENDIVDWHGELSIALCEAMLDLDVCEPDVSLANFPQWLIYASGRLDDCVRRLRRADCGETEIPSGLTPWKAEGRRRGV